MPEKTSIDFQEMKGGKVMITAGISLSPNENLTNLELMAKIAMLRSLDLLDSCTRAELLDILKDLEGKENA